MQRNSAFAITLLAVGIVAVPATGQTARRAVIARANATTSIQQPAMITSSQDLMFVMSMSTAASLTRLSATSARSTSSASARARSTARAAMPANMILSVGQIVPAPARATFQVSGDAGQSISVTVPQAVALMQAGGAGTAMLTTESSVSDGPQFLGGNFAATGTLSFDVGGQVTLADANAAAGTYNGVLAVVAQYN